MVSMVRGMRARGMAMRDARRAGWYERQAGGRGRAGAGRDDQLVEVLMRGDIRLVSAAWFRAQPEGFRISMRQDLEKLDHLDPAPLLSP